MLDLVKQKEFYLDEYMSDFWKFKEELPSKEKLFSSLTTDKKLVTKNMKIFLMFAKKLTRNNDHLLQVVFKIQSFVINWCFWKI